MSQIWIPGDAVPGQVLNGKKFSAGSQYQATGSLAPKMPNLIYNGDFSANLAGWTAVGSTANMYLDTWDYRGGPGKAIWQGLANGAYQGKDIPAISGHKYYFSGWAFFQTGAYNLFAGLNDQVPSTNWLTGNTAIKNQWQFASNIFTATPSTVTFTPAIGVWGDGRDVSAHYDGFMLIDLTDAFGAGKEPDKATMDAIVQANGGWWDSSVSLSIPTYPGQSIGARAAQMTGDGNIFLAQLPGYYDEAARVVAFNANLVAANIKAGVPIFGLTGTFSKNIARGTYTPAFSGNITTYNMGNGQTTGNWSYVQVTGLSFSPRTVMIQHADTVPGWPAVFVSIDPTLPYQGTYYPILTTVPPPNGSPVVLALGVADPKLTADGFLLPVPGWYTSKPLNWVAIG